MDQLQPSSSISSDPAPAEPADSPRPAARPSTPDWIDVRLRGLYDEVVAEPLPADLQAFVDRLTAAGD